MAQPREIDECVAETGRRPVELLAELGVLSDRFVAVHATHLAAHEAKLLGAARAFACVCATTEADRRRRSPRPPGAARSTEGAAACGFTDAAGTLRIRRDHPALELIDEAQLLAAIVFSGSSAMIDGVD